MKKIVFIAQSNGGVAEYLYMFLKNFKNEDYEKYLIVSNQYKDEENRFKDLVSEIFYVDMVRNIDIKKDMSSIIKIRKICKDIAPDIVYFNSSKARRRRKISFMV